MKFSKGISAVVIVVGVVGLILSVALYFIFNNLQSRVQVLIGDGSYQAQVVDTPKDREKGLTGITNLGDNSALLMIFPSEDNWKINMKGMKVSVDIVWLSKDKKVVYTVKNASPDDFDVVYTPTSKAKYVLELPNGSVDSMTINNKVTAIFSVNSEGAK